MHLAIFAILGVATWKWGDWKNLNKYHLTIMLIIIGNLLYFFLYCDHMLWEFRYRFCPYKFGELAYTLYILPLTTLIFLTNYPKSLREQIIHTIKFITIYFIIEWLLYKFGRIVYNNGWNIWWSLAWYFMMFPMLALHHKKPVAAYGASFVVLVLVLILFPVSFN